MPISLRPIVPTELEAFARAQALSFGYSYRPENLEHRAAIFEAQRSTAAFEGGQVVGTAGIFSFGMTVPGNVIPVAGVTMVSVQPTHRRRGILTALMQTQLREVRGRGEAVAALWASEAPIYGRFGYGLASQNADLAIERVRCVLRHDIPSPGTTRMLSKEEARTLLPAVYDAVRPAMPGFFSHTPAWWDHRLLLDPEWNREGASEYRYILYEEDGSPLGYTVYRTKPSWKNWIPDGTLEVLALHALTPAAYAALWRFLFGVDLVARIEARERSADEPLYWMLEDPRHLQRSLHDALWLRIVDVPAALEGRRYAAPGRLVLEVQDSFTGFASGRFALEGDPGGARCKPTDAIPDVTLGVAELGALYLGAHSLRSLVAAGRAAASPAAVLRADALFRWPVAAWCPEVF